MGGLPQARCKHGKARGNRRCRPWVRPAQPVAPMLHNTPPPRRSEIATTPTLCRITRRYQVFTQPATDSAARDVHVELLGDVVGDSDSVQETLAGRPNGPSCSLERSV